MKNPLYILLAVLGLVLILGGGYVVYGATRGFRNNNPFNLEISNIPWNNKIPAAKNTDGTFEQFPTMADGLHAGFDDIKNKIKRLGTISKIINAYAPASDNNDVPAYIAAVCDDCGVQPDDTLAPDFDTIKSVGNAIIKHEQGINPFPDSMINTAVNSVL